MTIALDNASNNKTMVDFLSRKLGVTFKGDDAHGNCATHIINLASKAVLYPFDRKTTDDASDDEEEYELPDLEDCAEDDDDDDDELGSGDDDDFIQFLSTIDEDGEPDEEDEAEHSLEEETAAVSSMLSKVRGTPAYCISHWHSRSANCRSRSFVQRRSCGQHGSRPSESSNSLGASSRAMSQRAGTQRSSFSNLPCATEWQLTR